MRISEEDKAFIADYDVSRYDRPSATADAVLFRRHPEGGQLQVLLVRRGAPPQRGSWALPGGFCEMEEPLAACSARELLEETGLVGRFYGQVPVFDAPGRDPRTRVLTTPYLMILPYGAEGTPQAGDDAAAAAWFDIALEAEIEEAGYLTTLRLSGEGLDGAGSVRHRRAANGLWQQERVSALPGLAFDHLEILSAALTLLRHKVYRTDLAYAMLPEVFTLNELQAVFEAIIGQELVVSTFLEHIKHDLTRVSDPRVALPLGEQAFRYSAGFSEVLPMDLWT